LCACETIRSTDPVSRYNDEFLAKNSGRVDRSRKKYFKVSKQKQSVSTGTNGYETSEHQISGENPLKMRGDVTMAGIEDKPDPISYNYGSSIYYRNRRLKEDFEDLDSHLATNVLYLKDNHSDYSQSKIDFIGIKPTNKVLHGELKIRRSENHSIPNDSTLQKCFDYVDLMNRTKKEIYMEYRNAEALRKAARAGTTPSTVKKKLLETFRKVR
jgi:hypothetical protein